VNRYAVCGSYVLLGVSAVVIGVCKAVEWANHQMKVTPKQQLR
jgi:hypothetical protein